MKNDLISRQALCEYALNQKDKSVTPNDIMRFPSAQPKCAKDFVMLKVIDLNDRPYYSIIYLENGNEFEGYSSYDLKVISEYLKRYFGFAQPEDIQKVQDLEQAQFDKIRELAYQEGKADAMAEIIRCRDCKCWRELPNGCQGFCDMHSTYPTLTDFCSWAERREVSK